MQEVFEKIINFVEKEIESAQTWTEHNTQIRIKDYVEQLEEQFGTDINVGSNGWISCDERLP